MTWRIMRRCAPVLLLSLALNLIAMAGRDVMVEAVPVSNQYAGMWPQPPVFLPVVQRRHRLTVRTGLRTAYLLSDGRGGALVDGRCGVHVSLSL